MFLTSIILISCACSDSKVNIAWFSEYKYNPKKVANYDIVIAKINQPFQITTYVQWIPLTEKNPLGNLMLCCTIN